jgi:hypothetical protein
MPPVKEMIHRSIDLPLTEQAQDSPFPDRNVPLPELASAEGCIGAFGSLGSVAPVEARAGWQ